MTTGQGAPHTTGAPIFTGEIMDIWKHIHSAGNETHPDKPQYIRGVQIFTCPFCGHEINSANFANVGYFQIACRAHLQSMACALAQAQRELTAATENDSADELPF